MSWTSNGTDSWSGWGEPSRLPIKKKELKTIDNPLTQEIAIDCEMVEATVNRRRFSVLARVSIVNSNCQPVLDTYVDPMYQITDYRTPYSGIRPEHLEDAPIFDEVRECVVNLVNGRTIIGHDLKQDLLVLGIMNLPGFETKDTSVCYLSWFRDNEKPSLKRLARDVLNLNIQSGAHDSMEDAIVTMQLYKRWVHSNKAEENGQSYERGNRRR